MFSCDFFEVNPGWALIVYRLIGTALKGYFSMIPSCFEIKILCNVFYEERFVLMAESFYLANAKFNLLKIKKEFQFYDCRTVAKLFLA